MPTPIIIFAYLRHDLLRDMIRSLKACHGFDGRHVYVFQDGLKAGADAEQRSMHEKTSALIRETAGPLWHVDSAPENMGLARSVHSGVSQVLAEYNTAIVLEDDLILAEDFLEFMDDCLAKFARRKDVYSISGFCHEQKREMNKPPEVFLFPRPGSWGWATWTDRWKGFELGAVKPEVLKDRAAIKEFDQGGEDMSWMLRNSLKGKVNSWAIQWAWYQFLNKAYSVYPECSKVQNTGFDASATHTKTRLEGGKGLICKETIKVDPAIGVNLEVINKYRRHYILGKYTRLKKLFSGFLN